MKIRILFFAACAAMLIQSPAEAQTAVAETPAAETSDSGSVARSPEYVPMTFSERSRKYILSAFGPGAVARAATSSGVRQLEDAPKEWREGPEAYGDRFGSAFAQNVIRQALEFGGSTALHQDNRYFRSSETGFGKRAKHAVASVFLARTEGGESQFAYSRFGAVLGSAFISRLWQPRSDDSAGDAAVSFGLHSDVFAARLLYALGYEAQATYFVRSGVVSGTHDLKRARPFIGKGGEFSYARFKLHESKKVTRVERYGLDVDEQPLRRNSRTEWSQNPDDADVKLGRERCS